MKRNQRYVWIGLTALLLTGGCARDPWAGAPEFEVSYFESSAPSESFLADGNFLMDWNLLGPIKPGATLHTERIPEEKILTGGRNAPEGARWYRLTARNKGPEAIPGQVDFSRFFVSGPTGKERGVFYACVTLKSEREAHDLVLAAGSCGKMKVWINGNAVYSYEKGARELKPDTDKVEGIALRRGFNRVVVKYMDNEGRYRNQRKFCLRFTDANGKPTRIR